MIVERIILSGRVPSKKNQKQIIPNLKNPKRPYLILPSAAHKKWHSEAKKQILIQQPSVCKNIISVNILFTFGDKRKTDLSNKAESIMDLLVDIKIIDDDSWQIIPRLNLTGQYEKDKFMAEILIIREE